MEMMNLAIYIIQNGLYAYFFAFFLRTDRRSFHFIVTFLLTACLITPLSLLAQSPFLVIPVSMSLLYGMLRLLFKKESRLHCLLSIFLYEGVVIFCEILTLILLMINDEELHPVSFDQLYGLQYYTFEFGSILLLYTLLILRFGPKRSFDQQNILWGIGLMTLQILSTVMNFFNFYEAPWWLIIVYYLSFFIIAALLLKALYTQNQKKKLEMTLAFLQKQLSQQCKQYILLKNQEQLRKLRHDYINFSKQQEQTRSESS